MLHQVRVLMSIAFSKNANTYKKKEGKFPPLNYLAARNPFLCMHYACMSFFCQQHFRNKMRTRIKKERGRKKIPQLYRYTPQITRIKHSSKTTFSQCFTIQLVFLPFNQFSYHSASFLYTTDCVRRRGLCMVLELSSRKSIYVALGTSFDVNSIFKKCEHV